MIEDRKNELIKQGCIYEAKKLATAILLLFILLFGPTLLGSYAIYALLFLCISGVIAISMVVTNAIYPVNPVLEEIKKLKEESK